MFIEDFDTYSFILGTIFGFLCTVIFNVLVISEKRKKKK